MPVAPNKSVRHFGGKSRSVCVPVALKKVVVVVVGSTTEAAKQKCGRRLGGKGNLPISSRKIYREAAISAIKPVCVFRKLTGSEIGIKRRHFGK